MRKIYVASSWRNSVQPTVVSQLREAGHQVYDFKNPSPYFSGFQWKDADLVVDGDWSQYRHKLLNHPICARGFVTDYRAMKWADTCVLVLPSGRSAHIEAGWFTGANKTCIILTQNGEEPELMYLLADHICLNMSEVLEALK